MARVAVEDDGVGFGRPRGRAAAAASDSWRSASVSGSSAAPSTSDRVRAARQPRRRQCALGPAQRARRRSTVTIRVLLVDDHELMRQGLRSILDREERRGGGRGGRERPGGRGARAHVGSRRRGHGRRDEGPERDRGHPPDPSRVPQREGDRALEPLGQPLRERHPGCGRVRLRPQGQRLRRPSQGARGRAPGQELPLPGRHPGRGRGLAPRDGALDRSRPRLALPEGEGGAAAPRRGAHARRRSASASSSRRPPSRRIGATSCASSASTAWPT